MYRGKRILSACLTLAMAFDLLAPSTVALAAERDVLGAAADAIAAQANEPQVDDAAISADGADGAAVADDATIGDASDSSPETPAAGEDAAPNADEGSDPGESESSSGEDTGGDAVNAAVSTDAAEKGSDDAAADVAATALITSLDDAIQKLKDNDATDNEIQSSDGQITGLSTQSAKALIALSNVDASLYENAEISFNTTGTAPLTGTDNSGEKFNGFGSSAHPFKGSFSSNNPVQLNTSLFNYYAPSSGAAFSIERQGTGSEAIFAEHLSPSVNVSVTVNVAFNPKSSSSDSTATAAVTAPLVGESSGNLTLDVTYSYSSSVKSIAINSNDDAGLLVGKVAENASLTISSFAEADFENASIVSTDGNAGLLVGSIGDASSLSVPALSVGEGGKISAKSNAGGLLGLANSNSNITVTGELDLSKLSIEGEGDAGGFIGKAENLVSLTISGKVTPASKVGTSSTSNAGGFIGEASFAYVFSLPDTDKLDLPEFSVAAKENAGGLFGLLKLANPATISGRDDISSVLTGGNNSATHYGGIVGRVLNRSSASYQTLAVANSTIKSSSSNDYSFYAGGLVGFVAENGIKNGDETRIVLKAKGVTVELANPTANRSFGGAVGCIDRKSFIDLTDFTAETENESSVGYGNHYQANAGGIVGEMWDESVLRLSGTTDLSQLKISDNYRMGQIVGFQNYALVYAEGNGSSSDDKGSGWKFVRAKKPSDAPIDDIGNYGEVIRLGDESLTGLIAVSGDYLVTIAEPKPSNGKLTISSLKEYAELVLYLQMHSSSDELSKQILSAEIELTAKIDLSGTGLLGLSRECDNPILVEGSATFNGTFNGNGNTITLAMGEPYGVRNGQIIGADDTSEGNGKLYRRDRVALFPKASGAIIKNVTIAGSINATAKSANTGKDAKNVFAVAAAVAEVTGDSVTFDGVTVSTNIKSNAAKANDTDVERLYLGGAVGFASAAIKLAFANATTIDSSFSGDGATGSVPLYFGGAVGAITDKANATSVSVDGLTVKADAKLPGGFGAYYAGGLIGYIKDGTSKKSAYIAGLAFDAAKFNFDAIDEKNAGGLLGYAWANTEVKIDGFSETSHGLTVKNSSGLSAKNAKRVGGLIYAASGKWTIGNFAIDMGDYQIDASGATGIGLIAYAGGSSVDAVSGDDALTGLYLEDTAEWADAYVVSGVQINSQAATFDEWVADTRAPETNIGSSGANGVISLKTTGPSVSMSDGAGRNTYVNRTTYGASHQTNQFSRYYYNLDTVKQSVGGVTGRIDSSAKLLMWGVRYYAAQDLKSYFESDGCESGLIGGASSDAPVTLDMSGYSYYPVDMTSGADNLTVQNATITFRNEEIEAKETDNKSTAISGTSYSQHYMMHCGLIRNYATAGSTNGSSRELKVDNVTFTGSVGKVGVADGARENNETASGALICGYVAGDNQNSAIATATVTISNSTLNGLLVHGCGNDYAPVLVNRMNSYTYLSAEGFGAKYGNVTAGSSLIGNVGGEDATQVVVYFTKVKLPDKQGVFTHASLLESFGYSKQGGVGSAIYNFTKGHADAGSVTYGKEIDGTIEYPGQQLWYYQAEHNDGNLVTEPDSKATANEDSPVFGGYLPYVFVYSNDGWHHEIAVNHESADIVDGCGTYGHPYRIANSAQLNKIANFLSTGTTAAGWKVRITTNQTSYCTASTPIEEAVYESVVNGSTVSWKRVEGSEGHETLKNKTILRYIQSAYYDITSDFELVDFVGLGSETNAFRGVIVSSDKKTVTLKADKAAAMGLIAYSYGSVVKDLTIAYSGTSAIAYKERTNYLPGAFFGGVIGCVLGGDNIIDGVTVKAGKSLNLTVNDSRTPAGDYVGVVAGGGVIFRNVAHGSTVCIGDASEDNRLYHNPILGRMLDGYAFAEGCSLDNGDKNYKIVTLDRTFKNQVSTGDLKARTDSSAATETTVKSDKGLLILSAIINSGAAAGPINTRNCSSDYAGYYGTNAYNGRMLDDTSGYSFGNDGYGKVRNATYGDVASATEPKDFTASITDDTKAPGYNSEATDATQIPSDAAINSPYLVASYATDWKTGYVCAAGISNMSLVFDDGDTFDVSQYGSAFLGLSGRYYTSAAMAPSDKSNYYGVERSGDCLTPFVTSINGNSIMLTVSQTVKEYSNDDFHVMGVGGLFSYAIFSVGGSEIKDLTVNVKNMSLEYIGSEKSNLQNDLATYGGVGSLIGVTATQDKDSKQVVFSRVSTVGETEAGSMAGPACVGGIIGCAGDYKRLADRENNNNPAYMVSVDWRDNDGGKTSFSFVDCSYSNLTIKGAKDAGGFAGHIHNASDECAVSISSGVDNIVAKDSSIKGTDSSDSRTVGGLFGEIKGAGLTVSGTSSVDLTVQNVTVGAENETTGGYFGGIVGTSNSGLKTENVSVSNTSILVGSNVGALGGIAGWCFDSAEFNNVTVTSDPSNKAKIGSLSTDNAKDHNYSGGLVGELKSKAKMTANNVEVSNIEFVSREADAGIVSRLCSGVSVDAKGVTVRSLVLPGSYSGGFSSLTENSEDISVQVSDSKFSDIELGRSGWSACWNESIGSCSGALVADVRGTLNCSNILVENITYKDKDNEGLLVGAANPSKTKRIAIAGVEYRVGEGQTRADLPIYDVHAEEANFGDLKDNCYVAFADYANTAAAEPSGSNLYSGEGTDAISQASPYVTTSPVSGSIIYASGSEGEATTFNLFGDAASFDTVQAIVNEKGKTDVSRYTYSNVGGLDGNGAYQNESRYEPSANRATFSSNNPGATVANDLDVLQVTGSTGADVIASYLGLVTNGGYSDAVKMNSDLKTSETDGVTATVSVFELVDGKFIKSSDSDASAALEVVNNGQSTMGFRINSKFDNGNKRFELLTVKFAAGGNSYYVQVPIIVRRMFEMDFTATFINDRVFQKSMYESLGKDAHVLIDYGETMTGMLSWTYNQDKGKKTEYGWASYLEDGGSMGPVNKTLTFNQGGLPTGTQLTLVDCRDNNRSLGYSVEDSDTVDGVTRVPLTFFLGADGEPWLSELLGVTAKTDSGGKWVVTDSAAEAVAKVDGAYYKYVGADSRESGARYKLEFPGGSNDKEASPSEDYYLVLRIPNKSGLSVNGYVSSETTVPNGVSFDSTKSRDVLRPRTPEGLLEVDNHSNTASSYSVLSNYTQALVDQTGDGKNTKVAVGSDGLYPLNINVLDTVTFDTKQIYGNNDLLYYTLDVNPLQFSNGEASSTFFPTGTTGTVKFYVTVGDQAYTFSGGSWEACELSTPAASYPWSADGDKTSLAFKTSADGDPLDLSGLRSIASGGAFTIRTSLDVHMTQSAYEALIVPSGNGTDGYTMFNYRGVLATRAGALSYSTLTASLSGTGVRASYYRTGAGTSTIKFTASKPDQLGIVVDDLKDSGANGTIGASGTYDLSGVSNAAEKIKQATAVKYTVKLQRRTGTNGTYTDVNDINNYVSISSCPLKVGDPTGEGAYVLTDTKIDDTFKTQNGQATFILPLDFKVVTDISIEQFYSNYRLVLTAQLLDSSDNAIDTPVNIDRRSDQYVNADYITYTLTRVKLDGISTTTTSSN